MIFSKSIFCLPLIGTLAILFACLGMAEAKQPSDAAKLATLRFINGDFVSGVLCDADQSDTIRWQGPCFTTPLDFDLTAIRSMDFPAPDDHITSKGKYCFELDGGELLFGSLLELTPEKLVIETSHFGRLHIQRKSLERMTRWRDGKNLIYIGPNGLSEWSKNAPENAWQQEATSLATSHREACLAGDFKIPSQAIIEIAFSWKSKPNFVLALGSDVKSHNQAFRIEMWKKNLICLWETKEEADLATIQTNDNQSGQCHLIIYLDQQRRLARVYSSEGTLLAEVSVSEADAKSKPKSGIRLFHRSGGFRLERLRITRCTNDTLHKIDGTNARLIQEDGTAISGKVERFDPKTQEIVFTQKDKTSRINVDKLSGIIWPKADKTPTRKMYARLHDGTRVGGNLRDVKEGRLWLTCPTIKEPLGVNVSHLRGLTVQNDSNKIEAIEGRRQGRLETKGVLLHGYLVDEAALPQKGNLAWQPLGCKKASLIKTDTSGRIVYRDRRPPKPRLSTRNARTVVAPARVGLMGRMAIVLAQGARKTNQKTTPKPKKPKEKRPRKPSHLYLRPGDTVTCDVERIDEVGVTFKSSVYDATFVPHDKIKALVLENSDRGTKINKTKRDRLLTLPRMRKNNPPTHLIRSIEGDYLCANLVSMDEDELTVEVRLEKRRLPRERITRIIWLHENDISPDKPDADKPNANKADADLSADHTRIQAIRSDDARVTFFFNKMTDSTLHGKSDVLGACRVELDKVDQLTIGTMIEKAAVNLPYQRWKLHHAQQPKFVQQKADSAEGTAGKESELVGKMAPDFKLELLDGKQFRLKDHRGKVVVLDFWASWCGACVQALPQIDRLVNEEFQDKDLSLIAVNLQEQPKAIKKALDRLKLETTVVMDQDGAVAEKYAATAIPQTVIIDRSGKVARLFIGGGPQYIEQVRKALEEVLAEKDKAKDSKQAHIR